MNIAACTQGVAFELGWNPGSTDAPTSLCLGFLTCPNKDGTCPSACVGLFRWCLESVVPSRAGAGRWPSAPGGGGGVWNFLRLPWRVADIRGDPPFCTRWRPGLTPRGLEVRRSGDPAGDRAWPPPSRLIPRTLAREGGREAASPGLAQTQLGFVLLWSARGPLASPARNQELVLGSGRNSWSVGSWASPGSLRPAVGEAAESPFGPWRTPLHTCSSKARPRGPGDRGDTAVSAVECETGWSPSSGQGAGLNPRAGCWDAVRRPSGLCCCALSRL